MGKTFVGNILVGLLGRDVGDDSRLTVIVIRGTDVQLSPNVGIAAIGGDLSVAVLWDRIGVPFTVVRDYRLPAHVGPNTLVYVSSYSGNTEETLAASRLAIQRGARLLVISSGGTLSELARRRHIPVITIPGGLPPRAALGYSFFPVAVVLDRLGLVERLRLARFDQVLARAFEAEPRVNEYEKAIRELTARAYRMARRPRDAEHVLLEQPYVKEPEKTVDLASEFADPGMEVRPMFRWWWPGALVDQDEIVWEDIGSIIVANILIKGATTLISLPLIYAVPERAATESPEEGHPLFAHTPPEQPEG